MHGYSGTPFEVLPLGRALADAGLRVDGPLLPGHGVDPAALNGARPSEWVGAVDAAFAALPAGGPRILVGCSMGALLCLDLAARRPADVAALVLLAPALLFHPQGRLGIAAARAGAWRVRPFLEKETPGGDVEDEDARRANPTYPVLPVRGLCALDDVRRRAHAALPAVKAPICVVFGAKDGTISPLSAEVVVRSSGAPLVESHVLPRSRHLVGIDVERDLVEELALAFVRRVVPGAFA